MLDLWYTYGFEYFEGLELISFVSVYIVFLE